MRVTYESSKEVSTLALWEVLIEALDARELTPELRSEAHAAAFRLMARASEGAVLREQLDEERQRRMSA